MVFTRLVNIVDIRAEHMRQTRNKPYHHGNLATARILSSLLSKG